VSAVGRRAWRRAGIVFALVLGLDQLTKILVRTGVEKGDSDPILPALKLVHVENRGVAFGAFSGEGQGIVLAIVAVALVGLVWYFATHATRPGAWLATGLLLGGAIGNIIDRVAVGAVTDFLKLPGWPAFNVADIAITAGVVALLIVVERSDDAEGDADDGDARPVAPQNEGDAPTGGAPDGAAHPV
jgi:signal peptidase II